MENTIQLKPNSFVNPSKNINVQKDLSPYEKFIKKLDFSYFGLISMTILVGSIIGAISASFILSNNAPIWELCVCVALSMANNSAGIAQAPTKWVFNIFVLSTILNIVFILLNI